jgi:uncharacterized protein (UPF0333 family)
MQQMCKVDDRGSATVELSIIMPVILLIIVMIIRLYLGLIYEGNVCGSTYSGMYLYETSSDESLSKLNKQLEEISESLLWNDDDRCSLSAVTEDGNISISSISKAESVTYKTEYAKCSSRLRRWQLYGDVIH